MDQSPQVSHRILISSNSEFLSVGAREELLSKGYVCDIAGNVGSFISKLRKADYSLAVVDSAILCDAQEVSPIELRKLAAGIPIILVLSHCTSPYPLRLADFWVPLVLGKSLSPGEFLKHVQSLTIHPAARVGDGSAFGEQSVSALSPDMLVDITCRSISQSLLNLRHLAQKVSDGREGATGRQDACHLFHCPRLDSMAMAIIQAVDVLERTKGAFKSKELGDLRKKLQALLRQAAVGQVVQLGYDCAQDRDLVMPGIHCKGGNE
jgi:hypothetical protein